MSSKIRGARVRCGNSGIDGVLAVKRQNEWAARFTAEPRRQVPLRLRPSGLATSEIRAKPSVPREWCGLWSASSLGSDSRPSCVRALVIVIKVRSSLGGHGITTQPDHWGAVAFRGTPTPRAPSGAHGRWAFEFRGENPRTPSFSNARRRAGVARSCFLFEQPLEAPQAEASKN